MKLTFLALALFVGNFLFAAQPPDLGHFKGLAFSSPTDRHPLEIQGGNLVKCKADASPGNDITVCEVEKGSLVVTGSAMNELNVSLTRVTVLRSKGETPRYHYYFRGTTQLVVGETPVTTDVSATLVIDAKTPNKVWGFFELPNQYSKSSVEAYRVN